MPTPSLSKSGLARRAYATMLERIVRGDYAIGQVISRRKIAADLGISFLPASEAFLRLECEGLLESRPRAGTRIRIPTRQDVEGHFTVREALEVQAAMAFAGSAAAEERAELTRLAARLDAGLKRRSTDPVAYLAQHEKLHLKIAEYAHCVALEEAIRRQSALGLTWLGTIRTTLPLHTHPKHELLIKTLARQTPAAAGETMRAHLHLEMEHTLRGLEPYFEANKKFSQTYSRPLRRKAGTVDGRASGIAGPEAVPPTTPPAHSPAAF
jgi:GntR family transcriptional regulator, rspAB operon transcriptional repressor